MQKKGKHVTVRAIPPPQKKKKIKLVFAKKEEDETGIFSVTHPPLTPATYGEAKKIITMGILGWTPSTPPTPKM